MSSEQPCNSVQPRARSELLEQRTGLESKPARFLLATLFSEPLCEFDQCHTELEEDSHTAKSLYCRNESCLDRVVVTANRTEARPETCGLRAEQGSDHSGPRLAYQVEHPVRRFEIPQFESGLEALPEGTFDG